jgi:hypothetical protein
MTKQEEIQIAINKLIEIIYKMYIRDIKNGKINSSVNDTKPMQTVGNLTKRY